MQPIDVPQFPRGFLFSEQPIDPPDGFVAGPVFKNFWVHPWTKIEVARADESFVVIIGDALPTRSGQVESAADHLLGCLCRSEALFLKALDEYGGRHAILFGNKSDIKVVNDATGMRPVFYATAGGVIASHAVLVEKTLGGDVTRTGLPYSYGYPGNRTPYTRTKILTPNTFYSMRLNTIRRFWPRISPVAKSVNEAAHVLLEASTVSLRAMAQDRKVALSLTAGIDSRAVLAIAMHAGVPFRAYTYHRESASPIDRLVAADLADMFGFVHTVVTDRISDSMLSKRLNEAHYYSQHKGWVGALREYFTSPNEISVIGSTLELGRRNFGPARDKGVPEPSSAESMAGFHSRNYIRYSGKSRIKKFGTERYQAFTMEAWRGFIKDTDLTPGILDPFIQFYWEHRMATWLGASTIERDFYSDPLVPFNSRRIFETMLGTTDQSRYNNEAVLKMIEMVDPRLLELPINPKNWPVSDRDE